MLSKLCSICGFRTDSPVELRSEADQHYIREGLISRSQCTYQASSPDEVLYIFYSYLFIFQEAIVNKFILC